MVIQAWAHGLPVVAAASQGPAALIRDGEDGLLVPVDDAEALAAAIGRAAGRSDAARPPGRSRRWRGWRREFSEAAVVAQWRALFADYGAG